MKLTGPDSYQLLHQILDSTTDLVYATDAAGQTAFGNQPLRGFLGDDYDQQSLDRLTDAPAATSNALKSSIAADCERLLDNAIITENSTGDIRTLSRKHKKVKIANGEVFDVAVYQDITSLRNANLAIAQQQKQLSDTNKALEALTSVAVELIDRHDLSSLMQRVVDSACNITGADHTFVAMIHESGDYLETAAASAGSDGLVSLKPKRGEGLCGEVWRTNRTIVINDYQQHYLKIPEREFVKQGAGIPIRIAGEIVGVIGLVYRKDKPSVDDQIDILNKFAQLVAVAIENRNLHEHTRRELVRTEAINELCQAIYSSTDLMPLLNHVCGKMVSTFNTSKVHIYRYQEKTGLKPLVGWEDDQGTLRQAELGGTSITSQPVGMWCIKNQQAVFIKRGAKDPRESTGAHQLRAKMKLGSMVCIPLIHNMQPWGLMFAYRRIDQQDFSQNDISLFNIIGSQTSAALHRYDLMNQLNHQAHHDSLTGLPNRLLFDKRLADTIEQRSSTDPGVAVIYLDLDSFKDVNDQHGHTIGDGLLRSVAARLQSCCGSLDTVARMGGDEFAIILPSVNSSDGGNSVAQKIADCFQSEFNIDGVCLHIEVSIGLSYHPDDALDMTGLLKNADLAMYSAKDKGGGIISMFRFSDVTKYEQRMLMESDLKQAIERGQFELYFQPKVSCRTETCDSVEALIRWIHPDRGFVSPAGFISTAEQTGLIGKIDSWVIEEACRLGGAFIKQGRTIRIAVNVSAQLFTKKEFVTMVMHFLEKHQYPSSLLELEVTESVVMSDIDAVVTRLSQLRDAGIKIAIDDFGTGYSSLKYLDDLPLDVLKIDKAFVDKLNDTADDNSLVKTIVLMAKAFNLTTVAEGVETEAQKQKVKELGCDYIQGYLYSKPVTTSQIGKALDSINSRAVSTETA